MAEQTEEPVSYVTPDMEQRKGVWTEGDASPPISESDVRKWAIAVHWPQTPPPIFWDAEYAAGTRWGGIIAPSDFNPFAWPVERPSSKPRKPMGGDDGDKAGRKLRGMNGGQVETYGVPMRPGDVITPRNRLRDWEERTTRLGHTLFSYSETEWHNQHGELVKRRVSTAIRY